MIKRIGPACTGVPVSTEYDPDVVIAKASSENIGCAVAQCVGHERHRPVVALAR